MLTKPLFPRRLSRRQWWIVGAILIALIIFRLCLPSLLLWYANRTLDRIPGYEANIEDVDVALWEGAYTIKGLHMWKREAKTKIPFVDIEAIKLSVEWKALLSGRVVSEIELEKPKINIENSGNSITTTPDSTAGWREQAEKLFPFEINRLYIHAGTLVYLEPNAQPPIDLRLTDLYADIRDITNRPNPKKPLPTAFDIQAVVFGTGKLNLTGTAQIFKMPNDFEAHLSLDSVSLTRLNDLARYHAGFDFSSGDFSLYSELKASKGQLTGYVKPIFEKVKIVETKDWENPLKAVWESLISVVMEIFTNHSKDRFATVIPIEGPLDKPDAALLTTIFNVIKNAFIKAFEPGWEEKES